jgi:hypothetical protein
VKALGTCRNEGTIFEPVKDPQIKKIAMIDMIEAARLETTELSSPKVTVFKLV